MVEDNRRLAAVLTRGLREEGFSVITAEDGPRGLALARDGHGEQAIPFDVVILDWMLPGLDGLEVLTRLRDAGHDVPVLMLTAKDAVRDRVRGLEHGADDYLIKPFAFEELIARVRALYRRRQGASADTVRVADLEVDTRGKVVRRGGHAVELSAREFAVLECLAHNVGRVVTRERLHDYVYGRAEETGSNVIDVYVGHLRRKLDREGAPRIIHTRRGQGYVLEVRE